MGEAMEHDCDRSREPWRLIPLANVPGGPDTLNPFHNPYPPLGCLDFQFYCRKEGPILAELHFVPRAHSHLVCPGYSILTEDGNLKMRLATNPWADACHKVTRWFTLDLFVYRQDDYIFMYDCRQASESLMVSVGAWILIDANATATKRGYVGQMARKQALKIPGFRDEWWTFPGNSARCVGNRTCEYLAECVTHRLEEGAVVSASLREQMLWLIVFPLLFVAVVLVAQMMYKYVHGIKIEPTQASTHY